MSQQRLVSECCRTSAHCVLCRWFFCGCEEFGWRHHLRGAKYSPFLYLMSCLFWVLRRLSLVEYLKPCLRQWIWHSKQTPATFTDLYIFAWFAVAISAAWWHNEPPNWLYTAWALFMVVQIVQTTFYHNLWRKVIGKNRLVYSHGRNLLIGLLNYFEITWLFGVLYWWNRHAGFDSCLKSVWQAIYFSFVTGATIGYGDITPSKSDLGFVHALVVVQSLVSITMLTIIIGHAIGALGSLDDTTSAKEKRRQKEQEQDEFAKAIADKIRPGDHPDV